MYDTAKRFTSHETIIFYAIAKITKNKNKKQKQKQY